KFKNRIMTKKKTVTTKAKVAKVNPEPEPLQSKVDEAISGPAESIISVDPAQDTVKEKEELKSNEIDSSDQQDPDTSKEPFTQMSFAEAEEQMEKGVCVALPGWGGFCFKKIAEDQIYVMTKEGDIVETPHDEYKESNEWFVVAPNEIQLQHLD